MKLVGALRQKIRWQLLLSQYPKPDRFVPDTVLNIFFEDFIWNYQPGRALAMSTSSE